MGPVKSFYKNIKNIIKQADSFENIKGTIVVDFSASILYNLVVSEESMLELMQKPPRNLSYIEPGIKAFHENMCANNLTYILILDGMKHPKKYASILRANEYEIASEKLYNIFKIPPHAESWSEIKKLWKNCKILNRADIHAHIVSVLQKLRINFLVAPFEADALVISYCLNCPGSYAMSTDADVWVMGAPAVIYQWDFNDKSIHVLLNDNVSHRNLTTQIMSDSKLPDSNVDICINRYYLAILSNLHGNDYMSGMKGVGWVSCCKLLVQLMISDVRTQQGEHEDNLDTLLDNISLTNFPGYNILNIMIFLI